MLQRLPTVIAQVEASENLLNEMKQILCIEKKKFARTQVSY